MAGICHVVCGGPCDRLDIALGEDDMLIAADAGYVHCLDASLSPDIFIGDVDSLPDGLFETIECERIELPCDKDDTDTLAACKLGLESGYVEFVLHAALGGDVGHEIANIQTLAYLHEQGAKGVLYGDAQRIHLVSSDTGPLTCLEQYDTRVSVFAFGGPARGVSERGLRWELDGATLQPGFPLGVSNCAEGDEFEISVHEGMLLVVIG